MNTRPADDDSMETLAKAFCFSIAAILIICAVMLVWRLS